MVEAAEKAHKLTEALRAKGVEAYEFHDRSSSIVTIGSFDSVGTPQPNGQIELNPQIHAIMQQYGADRSIAPGKTPAGRQAEDRGGNPLRRAAAAGRGSAPLDWRRLRPCRLDCA